MVPLKSGTRTHIPVGRKPVVGPLVFAETVGRRGDKEVWERETTALCLFGGFSRGLLFLWRIFQRAPGFGGNYHRTPFFGRFLSESSFFSGFFRRLLFL
jgi:hypothetical protein